MSYIVERLRFIAIDNAESLTEDEHNTLSEAVTLISEAEQREKDARAKALQEAAVVGYVTCAETRHVTLGDKVHASILALQSGPLK